MSWIKFDNLSKTKRPSLFSMIFTLLLFHFSCDDGNKPLHKWHTETQTQPSPVSSPWSGLHAVRITLQVNTKHLSCLEKNIYVVLGSSWFVYISLNKELNNNMTHYSNIANYNSSNNNYLGHSSQVCHTGWPFSCWVCNNATSYTWLSNIIHFNSEGDIVGLTDLDLYISKSACTTLNWVKTLEWWFYL